MRRTHNYLNRDFKKERTDDLLNRKERSKLMSKIRSKATKFEEKFISVLRKGTEKRFRANVSTIRGKPDIVFKKEKICVFLDSDFWHGWQYPRWKHLLKDDFWRLKIETNRARDKKVTSYLRRHDWLVIRLWEHDISKNCLAHIKKINKVLGERK